MTDPNHQKILDKVDSSREQAIEFLAENDRHSERHRR